MGTDASRPKVFAVVPVFQRLEHTLSCIAQLESQTYADIEIVIIDGGSRDGSLDTLRKVPGITLIADVGEQWWTGATWLGIDHALKTGRDDDFVLLVNDDTTFDTQFVTVLVDEAIAHGACVGAVIVDADDPTVILDAGITIDWPSYRFHVRPDAPAGGFNDEVDTLEGRGVLVPLSVVRSIGNLDRERLPHYTADFEFFCRAHVAGHKLGVTFKTRVGSHRAETGLGLVEEPATARELWIEMTSRRSMRNVGDQLRFVRLAGPPELRSRLQAAVLLHAAKQFVLRTPTARRLRVPLLVRFALQPYPFRGAASEQGRREVERLVVDAVLDRSAVAGWYDFRPYLGLREASRAGAATLWLRAWNPITKPARWRAFQRARGSRVVTA